MFNLVVIPTTCRDIALFKRALDSVLQQSKSPSLIIIADDSEEQNFFGDAFELPDKCALVKTDKLHCDAGSRNFAVDWFLANYPDVPQQSVIVSFLDDDDVWHLQKLEKIEKKYADERINFIGTRVGYSKSLLSQVVEDDPDLEKISLDKLFITNQSMGPQSISIRLSFWIKIGGFDPKARTHVGKEILINAAVKDTVYRLNAPLVFIDHNHGKPRTADQIRSKELAAQYVIQKYSSIMSKNDYLANVVFWDAYFEGSLSRLMRNILFLLILGGFKGRYLREIKGLLIKVKRKIGI